MHDPWVGTMVRGLPEGVGDGGWEETKGENRTTVTAQSIKYFLKNNEQFKAHIILLTQNIPHFTTAYNTVPGTYIKHPRLCIRLNTFKSQQIFPPKKI